MQPSSNNSTISSLANNSSIQMSAQRISLWKYALGTQLIVLLFVWISNSLLIFGIMGTKKHSRLPISKKLFILLSCVDLLTMTNASLHTILFYKFKTYKESLVIIPIVNGISHASHMLGIITFLIISWLRFLSVRNPLNPISNRKIYQVMSIGLTISIINGVLNSLCLFASSIKIYVNAVFWMPIFLGALCSLIIMNFLSYRKLTSNNHMVSGEITVHSTALTQENFSEVITAVDSANENLSYESTIKSVNLRNPRQTPDQEISITPVTKGQQNKKHAVVTLIWITVSYVVCNLLMLLPLIDQLNWFGIPKLYRGIDLQELSGVLYFLSLANTGLNSTIYIMRNKTLKQFYRQCWKKEA